MSFDFNLFKERLIQAKKVSARVPHEQQYNQAAAFSLIAYKNQDATQTSDLDAAKLNFENKYQQFLMLFGQYSNARLNQYPLTTPPTTLTYPITNNTNVFGAYPMKKPFT